MFHFDIDKDTIVSRLHGIEFNTERLRKEENKERRLISQNERNNSEIKSINGSTTNELNYELTLPGSTTINELN